MSYMLSTGVSGLRAFQTALDTTSHNIANASTPGYSRQRVDLSTATPQFSGSGWIGTGVDVESVSRSYDDLVATQVRSSSSSKSQWDVYSGYADDINNLFGDSATGLSVTLQDFFNAFQSVANAPDSTSERQVLIAEAQTLVSQLQSYGQRLDELETQVNTQLRDEATAITGLAQNIADLNAKITAATGNGGAPPNDLLDQRDALLDELATHVNVSTFKQDDGAVNVFIGNGQPLVIGKIPSEVVAVDDPYDASRNGLAVQTGAGVTDVTASLSGGTVGGLLEFRSELLDAAKNSLGKVAVTVSATVNAQQNAGMDLYGALGADLFTVGGAEALANANNAGTAALTVSRAEAGEITGSNYVLSRTAGGWSLQDQTTGAAVTLSGSGTALDPFTAEGLSIVVSGTAVDGDRFLIRPTSTAVDEMTVALTDPRGIAAAAPIVAAASSANTGSASITQGVVVDAADTALRDPVTIEFLSATTYTTDGGTTVNAYASGSPITLNGWEVTVSGAPAAGDTFTVQDNSDGTGDNRNALLMANLLNANSLAGGAESINDVVDTWVTDIGVKSNQAQSNLDIHTALYDDNVAAQQSVSGVNLDEEAANLVRYQQAYSAAAQVIAIANQLFDSLLSAVRS